MKWLEQGVFWLFFTDKPIHTCIHTFDLTLERERERGSVVKRERDSIHKTVEHIHIYIPLDPREGERYSVRVCAIE